MAKGRKCPCCGYWMTALEEERDGRIWRVLYECRAGNCRFREKVDE